MKLTPHEILFWSIDSLCCGPDAAQAGTANSPWPRSSRASCFNRVVKRVLIFEQAAKSWWFHCCSGPLLLDQGTGQLQAEPGARSSSRISFPGLELDLSLQKRWGDTCLG